MIKNYKRYILERIIFNETDDMNPLKKNYGIENIKVSRIQKYLDKKNNDIFYLDELYNLSHYFSYKESKPSNFQSHRFENILKGIFLNKYVEFTRYYEILKVHPDHQQEIIDRTPKGELIVREQIENISVMFDKFTVLSNEKKVPHDMNVYFNYKHVSWNDSIKITEPRIILSKDDPYGEEDWFYN